MVATMSFGVPGGSMRIVPTPRKPRIIVRCPPESCACEFLNSCVAEWIKLQNLLQGSLPLNHLAHFAEGERPNKFQFYVP
jgi:hypothetical protein